MDRRITRIVAAYTSCSASASIIKTNCITRARMSDDEGAEGRQSRCCIQGRLPRGETCCVTGIPTPAAVSRMLDATWVRGRKRRLGGKQLRRMVHTASPGAVSRFCESARANRSARPVFCGALALSVRDSGGSGGNGAASGALRVASTAAKWRWAPSAVGTMWPYSARRPTVLSAASRPDDAGRELGLTLSVLRGAAKPRAGRSCTHRLQHSYCVRSRQLPGVLRCAEMC